MSSRTWIRISWADFIATVKDRGLTIQQISLGSSLLLRAADGDHKLETIIHTDGNMASEYTEYQSYTKITNKLLDPRTPDNRKLTAVNRIPSGYSIYPTGAGDHIANGTYGNGPTLLLDANNLQADFQLLHHWFGLGGRVIWEGASVLDRINATLIAPASSGFTQAAGDFNKVEVSPGSGMHIIVPAASGQGSWSANLADKLPNTSILKATPVPSAGNNGYFDYDSDDNVLTVNAAGTGGYNLYDFDVSLFKFANQIFGRKGDGRESVLESTDVVGKLLYNTWKIRFNLTPAEGNTLAKCAVIITAAAKKNL